MEKPDILAFPSDAEIETGLSQAFLVLEDRDQGRYRRISEYVLQVRDRTLQWAAWDVLGQPTAMAAHNRFLAALEGKK